MPVLSIWILAKRMLLGRRQTMYMPEMEDKPKQRLIGHVAETLSALVMSCMTGIPQSCRCVEPAVWMSGQVLHSQWRCRGHLLCSPAVVKLIAPGQSAVDSVAETLSANGAPQAPGLHRQGGLHTTSLKSWRRQNTR